MMSGKALLIGGLAVAMATVIPAPKISFESPSILYGAAIYKAITGDAGAALRLLERSNEQAAPAPLPAGTASQCTRARHVTRG